MNHTLPGAAEGATGKAGRPGAGLKVPTLSPLPSGGSEFETEMVRLEMEI